MFDKVLLVGVGTVAVNCAKFLNEKKINLTFIENRNDSNFSAREFCFRNGIRYEFKGKDEFTQFLLKIKDKVLIISASNRYIFPSEVLNRKNITVINYHSALLPRYPGRNAEAWAIFEGDRIGGITWHYVVSDVDAGPIIIQKQIPIDSTTTSFTLLRQYNNLASDAFAEIIDSVLNENIVAIPQHDFKRDTLRYSWMKPNNGELDFDWSAQKISNFLRAMDYGPFETLGNPYFNYNRSKFIIVRYKIFNSKENRDSVALELDQSSCIIEKTGYTFALKIQIIPNY